MPRSGVLRLSVSLALATVPSSVASASDQAVAYDLLHRGDPAGAVARFEEQKRQRPNDLAPAFGWLLATYERHRDDRALPGSFDTAMDQFIATASERHRRQPADGEALFFLAYGHMLRGRYRLDYDKGVWGAARDGAKAKRYIEEYLAHHPRHGDAYLALGLYNYYVDIAPTFVKALRALLFLPAGNRVDGLKQLERAAREGTEFGPLAATFLVEAYSWYEGRGEDALKLARQLRDKYPNNARLRVVLAELYESPAFEAFDQAAREYEAIVDLTADQRDPSRETLHYRAILGHALALAESWRLVEATEVLAPVVNAKPARPQWAWPQAVLMRERLRALLDASDAGAATKVLAADAARNAWHKPAREQLEWMGRFRQSGESRIFAAVVPANRLVVERRWDQARQAYDHVRQLAPSDWQVRYRLAHLEMERGMLREAERQLRAIAETREPVIDWVRAQALLDLGRVLDLQSRRREALKAYRMVVRDHERSWAAGRARLGLVSPYRGRPNLDKPS